MRLDSARVTITDADVASFLALLMPKKGSLMGSNSGDEPPPPRELAADELAAALGRVVEDVTGRVTADGLTLEGKYPTGLGFRLPFATTWRLSVSGRAVLRADLDRVEVAGGLPAGVLRGAVMRAIRESATGLPGVSVLGDQAVTVDPGAWALGHGIELLAGEPCLLRLEPGRMTLECGGSGGGSGGSSSITAIAAERIEQRHIHAESVTLRSRDGGGPAVSLSAQEGIGGLWIERDSDGPMLAAWQDDKGAGFGAYAPGRRDDGANVYIGVTAKGEPAVQFVDPHSKRCLVLGFEELDQLLALLPQRRQRQGDDDRAG